MLLWVSYQMNMQLQMQSSSIWRNITLLSWRNPPFAISYNPIAEAWIIEGTLPPGWVGGVTYIALAKENGNLLMMHGTR
ncbi:NTF2 fold immunity protein [Paenibacillus puldeungensis]|uniref:NTF2 fold immunity protein n=1 Tax=Paenibacillus puldeungensis TaxID=696536 RepID=A0ABW3RUB5_9BACL